ncbi:MAG: ribonuclease H-like domain-containing protein [Lachnospiraceae bacterium]|nr:ribonuclease H-like domain-containing protein [Lachnospiraceae bacterium]
MKVLNGDFTDIEPNYPIESLLEEDETQEDILFIDIETTGLTPENSNLYMIGAAYFKDNGWHYIQWLAEKYEEELQILKAFAEFSDRFKLLIHYNGNRFDLPYLIKKREQFSLVFDLERFRGIDIYRRISGYRDILGLPDVKQKTIESFLGLDREDVYSGGELISKYHDFVCYGEQKLLTELILHNREDIKGMLICTSMLAYPDMFLKPIRVMGVRANYYDDARKKRCQEIIMKLRFTSPLPKPFSFRGLGCYFSGNGLDGVLKVPLYEEEMKYFYANFRDYYYLPAEDIAIHKSIATFVDKEHRIQAKAANCYTRKKSHFLPQWDVIFSPFYKREYKSKEIFFELTDEFKTSRSGFNLYAEHVLSAMFEYGER